MPTFSFACPHFQGKITFDEQNMGVSAVRDRQGYYFVVAQGQLFRMTPDNQRPRLVAPLFEPWENHPFADGRVIDEVYFDHAGNVFFDLGSSQIVFLPAPAPSDTQVTVRSVAVDAFDINCTATAKGTHWFIWRRAGHRWSPPQSAPKIELRDLPGGANRVEVAVIDRFLHRDPTPAVVTLQVALDPQAQVVDFIADLSSVDYTRREKAVAGLARQPERSLAALKAARPKANADLRWWIDAAVQAIEEAMSK